MYIRGHNQIVNISLCKCESCITSDLSQTSLVANIYHTRLRHINPRNELLCDKGSLLCLKTC